MLALLLRGSPDRDLSFLASLGRPTIREVTRHGQILGLVLPALIVVALFACYIRARRAQACRSGGMATLRVSVLAKMK